MEILKRILVLLLILIGIVGIFLVYSLYINPKSPLGHAEYKNGEIEIDIRYYRPFKNDRLIFGSKSDNALVPYGEYWRLGANLTTKMKINKVISFGGRSLEAGTYGLYAYPEKENWMVIINTKTGGISFSEPNPDGVIMKINIATQSLEVPLEQFTIDFIDNYLRMRWDSTQVTIPIN